MAYENEMTFKLESVRRFTAVEFEGLKKAFGKVDHIKLLTDFLGKDFVLDTLDCPGDPITKDFQFPGAEWVCKELVEAIKLDDSGHVGLDRMLEFYGHYSADHDTPNQVFGLVVSLGILVGGWKKGGTIEWYWDSGEEGFYSDFVYTEDGVVPKKKGDSDGVDEEEEEEDEEDHIAGGPQMATLWGTLKKWLDGKHDWVVDGELSYTIHESTEDVLRTNGFCVYALCPFIEAAIIRFSSQLSW